MTTALTFLTIVPTLLQLDKLVCSFEEQSSSKTDQLFIREKKMSFSETIEAKNEPVDICAEEEVVCEQCESSFPNQFVLKKHISNEHVQAHVCDTCSTTFKTKRDLKRHRKIDHKQPKPFICHTCNSAHPTEYKLTQHIKVVHEKIKPYSCDSCPWIFGRSWELVKHKLYVHDKYKPFECPHCQRKIARKDDLASHIKLVHEQVKPFSCDKCGKCFGLKYSLAKHDLLMHDITTAKYPCSECGKLFRTSGRVKEHYKFVHAKIRNFKCQFCDLMFETGSTCRRHMRVHIKKENLNEVEAKALLEKHKRQARFSYNRSFSMVPIDKDENTQKTEVKEPQQVEIPSNSFRQTIETSPTHETKMDLLDDVLNDFDMAEELGETLEYIKQITYPNPPAKSTLVKKKRVSSKLKKGEEKVNVELKNSTTTNQSELEDSGFDNSKNIAVSSSPKVNKDELNGVTKSKMATTNSTCESWSNMLEIYKSSTTKEPISNQEWIQVEKFLICQLTTEISTGVISALQVKISNSGYAPTKKMGFIYVLNSESRDWYQNKVGNFSLDGKCFRAWTENEEPEVHKLKLILPSKLDCVNEALVTKLLGSFNPQLQTSQLKIDKFEKIKNSGRNVHLIVSKEAFEFVQENDWKLDFLMGKVMCEKA